MDVKKRWQEAQEFLRACTNEPTHIFHDSDADGVGAGLLLLHALTDLGVAVSSSTRQSRQDILSREELELVKDCYQPTRIIVVDMNPVDFGAYDDLRAVFTTAEFLIIDHHRVTAYDDAVFLHPQELFGIDGAKYCSAKLVLDLASSVIDVSAYEWLAAVGIVGDMNTEYFQDVIIRSLEREGFAAPDDLRVTDMRVVNQAILCCSAKDEEDLISYVNDLKECRLLREAILLGNPCPEVRAYVDELIRAASEQVSADELVNWLFIDGQLSVSGWVGTALSVKHPGKLFVLYREKEGGYSMSFRCQKPVMHCGDIARSCADTFGGVGGGHKPAAGAWVAKESFKEFQACVKQAVAAAVSKDN